MTAWRIRGLGALWAIVLWLPVSGGAAADISARLDFPVNEPVIQRSRVTMDVSQQRAEGRKYIGILQESESELELNTPINKTPYDLTVTLKQLRVGVEIGDKIVSFDSKSSTDSPLMQAFSHVIGVPFRLKVGDQLEIVDAPEKAKELMNHLKSMGGFNITHLLSEIVKQRFAFAGQTLEVGKSYHQVLMRGADGQSPIEITYRVVEITPQEVRATVEGTLPPFGFEAPPALLGLGVIPSSVKMSGSIEGKVVWNRTNALLSRSKINYLYRGEMDERGQSVPFELRMTYQDVTQRP